MVCLMPDFFPKSPSGKTGQNGKENGKAATRSRNHEMPAKPVAVRLTSISRDSRFIPLRDCPDFPAIPAPPIRGRGTKREHLRRFELVTNTPLWRHEND